MDFSMPSLGSTAAPRAAPDLRPSADAATTARAVKPPTGAPVDIAAPVSAVQAGLVSRSIIATDGEPPVEAATSMAAIDPAQRVLKPFGVDMLPYRDDERGRPDQPPLATEGPDASDEAGLARAG